jgi:hypothetical protein
VASESVEVLSSESPLHVELRLILVRDIESLVD